MKRIPIALIAILLACTSVHAASVDEVLSGLQSYWKTVDTFTARFVQKKHLALFADDVTSRGTFAYKKPGNMVWRYDPPDNTIMGIKPALGLIVSYSPDIRKAKRIHFPPGGIPPWMSFGLGSTNDIGALKNAAAVTVAEVNGVTVLTFAPKDTKEAVKEVAVSLKKDYTPLKVRITERNADFTVIEFSEQRLNPPVSDALFDVKIPRGVTVEDIGK
jgi:outer membrane lipoprotein-sorting protein